jgi:putative transposase
MKKTKSLYHGHRFPAIVISCAVRWYFRFSLSLRDIEELLLERGLVVTYETIRCWCDKFGAGFAQCARAVRRKPGSTWHLDEMFVTLRGESYLLWRAVDEHGAELDVLVQKRRDKAQQSASFSGCCVQTRCRAKSLPTSCAVIRRRRRIFLNSLR